MQNNLILSSLVWNLGILKAHAEGKTDKFSLTEETVQVLDQLGFNKEVISILKAKESEDYKLLERADRYAYGLSIQEYNNTIASVKFPSRLLSIFSQVGLELENKPTKKYYPVDILTSQTKPSETTNVEQTGNYKKIYDSVLRDLKGVDSTLATSNFNQYILTLLSILESHLSLVPAPLSEEISMYDHLCTMTAITSALSAKDALQKEKFVLLQGDFSGIQSFIFSKQGESNKHIAKTLRAKSFFVSMATQVIAYKLCNALDLPFTSIVMNAGGKFTILAPNLDIENRIKDLKNEVIKEFEEISYGQTKFILAHISFEEKEFESNSFSKVYSKLAMEFEKQKLKYEPKTIVFTDYLKDNISNKRCSICGIEEGTHELEKSDNPDVIGKLCKQFVEWGTNLTKMEYIRLKNLSSNSKIFDSIEFIDSELNIKKDEILFAIRNSNNKKVPFKKIANYIPIFSEEDIRGKLYKNKEWDASEKPSPGKVKTFEQIGLSSREIDPLNGEPIGRDHLAVLKADIDNLGQIFINGFKRGKSDSPPLLQTKDKEFIDKSSLAKVASLSRFLDHFFLSWLKDIIRNKFVNIYTIFAGGDDLFLIGNYREIFDLTNDLISHLQVYAGDNKDIHISSGIILTKDKVPVYQLKNRVEEELEKSKKYEVKNDKDKPSQLNKKNAITCFGITMTNQEYCDLLKSRNEYEVLIQNKVSTHFLFKLLTFIQMNENIKDKGKSFNPRSLMWRPLFSYHVYREYITAKNSRQRNSDQEHAKENIEIEELKQRLEIISEKIENYSAKLILPINLVLYKHRS